MHNFIFLPFGIGGNMHKPLIMNATSFLNISYVILVIPFMIWDFFVILIIIIWIFKFFGQLIYVYSKHLCLDGGE